MSELQVSKNRGKGDGSEMMHISESPSPTLPFGRWFGMNPFGLMREFTSEMDRVFRLTGSAMDNSGWAPAIDVQQCGGSFVVAAELPGLKKDEVKVELTDNALIIEGERKREHIDNHEGYHRSERSYGRFYRAVGLPEGARTDQIRAELKDGLLKVSIPVPETRKRLREVPIQEVAKGPM